MQSVGGLDCYSRANLFFDPVAVPRSYQTSVGRSKKINELSILVIGLHEDAWYKYLKLLKHRGSITEEKMSLEIHFVIYYQNYTPIWL